VLDAVVTGTDAAPVVDCDVLGSTLTTLDSEVLLAEEVEAAGEVVELVEEVALGVDGDGDVTLAVLDTALELLRPLGTVGRRDCVALLMLILTSCDAVFELATAETADCVVTVAIDEAAPDTGLEARVVREVEATVDAETVGKLVDELELGIDDEIALAVLEATLAPPRSPRAVESNDCVVAMLTLLVLALCCGVLRFDIARTVDCNVTSVDEEAVTTAGVEVDVKDEVDIEVETEVVVEVAPIAKPPPAFTPTLSVTVRMVDVLALETGIVLKIAARDVIDTVRTVDEGCEAEELELIVEADTKIPVPKAARLADVVATATTVVVMMSASDATAVVVLAASTVLRPLSTTPMSAELLEAIDAEIELVDESDTCDAKTGKIVVTAPVASDVTVARMVVLITGAAVVIPVGTTVIDDDVDAFEAPRSRLVLTTLPSVLMA